MRFISKLLKNNLKNMKDLTRSRRLEIAHRRLLQVMEGLLTERIDAGDMTAKHQSMHIIRAFVGKYGF
ncbi:hypothetical protein Lery_2465 [Legionella erythra]|uniref:Uncharacterized protein n=1 Tax=Legionella erythra TaxID=448 RepID=A0A0W0TFD0_LEGER|nr:hypothetical protein Lery_2465 [Legionella erythra]